MRTLPMA
nr:unknown [Zea mays]